MIKAIIFDCFGVLTTDTWNEFLDGLSSDVDIQAAREVHRQYDAGLIDIATSTAEIKRITGQTFMELEGLRAKVVKNSLLLSYIIELKSTYKIGLLSNIGNNWIRESFLTPDEQKLFDEMVLSYEVGTVKPDERMYQLICDRLDVQFDQAVMIDDKLSYCEAAQALGMQAIQYTDLKSMKNQLETLLVQN